MLCVSCVVSCSCCMSHMLHVVFVAFLMCCLPSLLLMPFVVCPICCIPYVLHVVCVACCMCCISYVLYTAEPRIREPQRLGPCTLKCFRFLYKQYQILTLTGILIQNVQYFDVDWFSKKTRSFLSREEDYISMHTKQDKIFTMNYGQKLFIHMSFVRTFLA